MTNIDLDYHALNKKYIIKVLNQLFSMLSPIKKFILKEFLTRS